MKKLIALALALPLSASAMEVTVTPTDVNRIFGNTLNQQGIDDANTHNSDYFSTYGQPNMNQKTLVLTTGAAFLSAIEAQVGAGTSYTINSVVLTIGSTADAYASTGSMRAYEVLHSYDHDTVTWNTFNAGGVKGVDYRSTAVATGVISGDTTTWTFPSDLILSWINGTSSDYGLYFPDAGAETSNEYTEKSNVVWTLDVTAVPEPSSLLLMGIGGMGLLWKFRRRQ